ncbi:S-adenosyl-L-methionine-dependent methyltransferase [Endogone sp. FLAS-F59071]|nr:S-adenosyl-L-methionine-dependent methyltransferase [Endogone sp. FLAS-F59071]|eukprot:RUS17424.1 S-adenosyl-L-methionine-dependent methyltransferase [Endogone sp. FLAS-F59071]
MLVVRWYDCQLNTYRRHSNYQAPVTESLKKGIKVLDVGCGTGVWSFELATEFPNSIFIGTDITNVFLATAAKSPPNLKFLEADTLAGLPFEDNTFDYVFQRLQVGSFSMNAWPGVLRELLRVAKPGSYIELCEY